MLKPELIIIVFEDDQHYSDEYIQMSYLITRFAA